LIHYNYRSASQNSAQHAPVLSSSPLAPDERQSILFDPSTAAPGRRTCNVHFKLAWFGLSKQKTTWHARRRHCGRHQTTIEEERHATCETIAYYWTFRVFGFGLRWSQYRHAGKIAPSLSVYPIVENFDASIYTAMKQGSAEAFQQLIRSGIIHPFTRNCEGESLLHVSSKL
jgi:hypothetical protein